MYEYRPSISLNERHYTRQDGLSLGTSISGTTVRVPVPDIQGHILITGKTGSGKSSLVAGIMKDLSGTEGCNIMLLDPHGKLAEDFVVSNQSKELVYISPRVIEGEGQKIAIQLNGIIGGDRENPENSLGWVRELFSRESALSNNTWGPRLEVIFRTLLSEMVRQRPDSNLSDLASILTNQSDLKSLLRQSGSPAIREFMDMQMKDWRNWNQYVSSALNKLLPIISSSTVSALISSRRDSFDLGSAIEGGNHAFVIEVSKTTMPEDTSRILTSIFLQRFWAEHLALRKTIETYIIVDECQFVESSLLERLLSEGRKYGLHLVLITQSISLLGTARRNAILSNVRNFISFPVSDEDAVILSRTVATGARERDFIYVLKNQELHRAVIWSQGENGLAGPLSFSPSVMDSYDLDGKLAEKITSSIKKYGQPVLKEDQTHAEMGRHARLVDAMERYLATKKIPLIVNQKVNDLIPDGLFTVNGTEYVLEVECSDLDNIHRIFRKIKGYPRRKIVFMVYLEDAERLFSTLTGAFRIRRKGSSILEIPIYRESDTIYFRDVRDYLERIFIVASDGKNLQYHSGLEMKRFSLSSLATEDTFMGTFRGVVDGQLRSAIYGIISSSGYPYILASDPRLKAFDNSTVLDLFGKRAIIALPDLFKTKA
ncbi:MAG: type IV secretion system DNA-binding domain-containing protein [Candidatus Thermoplasmatota archaeon]|nr:type IV secretion system DNA-binding domain-containing protein [Candidatus Thermoplasmatota archaeon]